VEVAKSAKK